MSDYVVVLELSEPLEGWHEHADELVRVLHRPRYDVVRAIRKARGIVFESLEGGEAEFVASVLERMGRRTRVVEASRIPSLGPVHTIRNADCTPEGLMIQVGYTPRMKALPWAEVKVISACSVRRSRTRKAERWEPTPGPGGARLNRQPQTEHKQEYQEELCDVLTLDPILHVRFESKGFNYDYLGKRLTSSATDNFCLLVSDLVRMSPAARLAADAPSFAGGNYPSEPLGPAEFDAMNRHALALVSLGA